MNEIIQGSALKRFEEWMHGRGGFYATLKLKYYKDGEPYFSSQGAEMSLSDFLKRENELTGKRLSQQTIFSH